MPSAAPPPPGDGSSRRPLALVGIGAVVLLVVAVVLTRGGGGGDCLSGLADNVRPDANTVSGTDVDRASSAGLPMDGSTDELVDVLIATNVQIDPLNAQNMTVLGEEAQLGVGYDVDDVDCWVGELAFGFVADGSFDADAVIDAEGPPEEGNLTVDGGRLAYDPDGDPDGLLDPESPVSPTMHAMVEGFDDHGAITFTGVRAGDRADGPWVGVGLAGGGGTGWELVAVWALADVEEASSRMGPILDAIEEGSIPSMIEGDPVDLLRRDRNVVWMRAPLTEEAAAWREPVIQFDPMFGIFADWADDGDGSSNDNDDDDSNDNDDGS